MATEDAHEAIQENKDGSFAMSEMGMMLYTNGYNLRGQNKEYPNGMVYTNGEHIFGVGYFAKEGEQDGHLMIVAPRGDNIVQAVDEFIEKARAAGIAESSVYVRFLDEDKRDQILEAEGYDSIEKDPWHPEAMQEDEQYPSRVVTLDKLLNFDEQGNIKTKVGGKLDMESVMIAGRDKVEPSARLSCNGFQNFLEKNNPGAGLKYVLEPYEYSKAEQGQAQEVVEQLFEGLSKHKDVVGSTPEDYFSLLKQKPHGKNGKDYFAYLGKLVDKNGKEQVLSFFMAERLSKERVGLYWTITVRWEDYIQDKDLNPKGFPGISQYAYVRVFEKMRQERQL